MSDEAVKLARDVIETGRGDCSADLARAVIAQAEELASLKRMATGCPCHHTTPCSDMCSCAHPLMSAGCRRCALYGSEEQRQGAARRLAAQAEELAKLRAALAEASAYLDSEGFDETAARLRRLADGE